MSNLGMNQPRWIPQHPHPLEGVLKCDCNLEAVCRLTKKTENGNQGRQFFVCPRNSCKYYKWADEAMSAENGQSGQPTPFSSQSSAASSGTVRSSVAVPSTPSRADQNQRPGTTPRSPRSNQRRLNLLAGALGEPDTPGAGGSRSQEVNLPPLPPPSHSARLARHSSMPMNETRPSSSQGAKKRRRTDDDDDELNPFLVADSPGTLPRSIGLRVLTLEQRLHNAEAAIETQQQVITTYEARLQEREEAIEVLIARMDRMEKKFVNFTAQNR